MCILCERFFQLSPRRGTRGAMLPSGGGGAHKPFVPPARVPLHTLNAEGSEQGAVCPPRPQPPPVGRPGAFRPPTALYTPSNLGFAVAPVGTSFADDADELPPLRSLPASSGLPAARPSFTAPRPAYAAPVPRAPGAGSFAVQQAAPGRVAGGPVAAATSEYYRCAYHPRSQKKRKNKVFVVRIWLTSKRRALPPRVRSVASPGALCDCAFLRAQDGVLRVLGNQVMLYASDGKRVATATVKGVADMPDGAELCAGNWEVEVGERLTEAQFLSGDVFVKAATQDAGAAAVHRPLPVAAAAPFKAVTVPVTSGAAPNSFYNTTAKRPAPGSPLHDPGAPNALVLCTPGDARLAAAGTPCNIAVVVDPHVGGKMRPHQREGVQFMFEAVMGMRDPQHHGCMLCDAMGLGKTLQAIALMWTLLRQSPTSGPATPVTRRALIVCPASLVDNWVNEIKKWLGPERCGCTTLRGGGAAAAAHAAEWASLAQTAWPVLVVSYETLRSVAQQLSTARVGLMVCDEGHRLKNAAGSKTLDALRAVQAPRKVILSGTPVQNNLGELFALVELVTPGLLGDLPTFRRVFEQPIAASRDKHASGEAKRLGSERTKQLGRLLAPFVLRRLGTVNAEYLPPRSDYVVFCRPSDAQHALYTALLALPQMQATVRGGMGALPPLAAILMLRRLCNAPAALLATAGATAPGGEEDDDAGDAGGSAAVLSALRPLCPPEVLTLLTLVADGVPTDGTAPSPSLVAAAEALCRSSGKFTALASILRAANTAPVSDRVVVVSGWAATLTLAGALCSSLGLATSRLDGTVAPEARQALVRRFNAGHGGRVFLLSTRAGGVGLNLIGANRLVLFDSDWNPSHDLQAMGRVWRDGQTKPVSIYRLLTTGTMEERVFQRQVLKGELASLIESDAGGVAAAEPSAGAGAAHKPRGGTTGRHFTPEELRELFQYRGRETRCDTADLVSSSASALARQWQDASGEVQDVPLRAALDAGVVTFVYVAPTPAAVAAAEEGDEAEEEEEDAEPGPAQKKARRVVKDDSEDDDAA